MLVPNMHYADLKGSYLFYTIEQKAAAFLKEHPEAHLHRLGKGDVSLPLCDAVIKALHGAVDDQANGKTFHVSPQDHRRVLSRPRSGRFG